MVELHGIFALLNAGTSLIAWAVAYIAWRRRAARGAPWLALGMLGVAIWSGAAAVMWQAPTLSWQVFWLRTTFLGVSVLPVAVLILALTVAKMDRWRTSGWIAFWLSVAVAFLCVRLLNPGRQYDVAFVAQGMGSYTHYEPVTGPLYAAYNVFAFAVIGAGLAIIARAFFRSRGSERTQAAILFVGGLVPFIASAVTESRVFPLAGLDLGPPAFLGTGLLWLVAVLGGTLLDIVPVARDALVEQMSDGVVVLDQEDRVVDVNPAALRMLHLARGEALGEPVDVLLGGLDGAVALLAGSGAQHAVLSMAAHDDSRHIDLTITPLVTRPGKPSARLVTLHDVTEEQRANQGLMLARSVFDAANEGIVVTRPDASRQIVDVNEAFCRLTGRSREDTVGRDLSVLQSSRHAPEFYEAALRTLFTTGGWQGEVWQDRADGSAFLSWLSISLAKDDQDHTNYVVGVFTDIAEISRVADEKLRHHATHDALTGLPNRLLLDDRLEHALARARRLGSGLAVLLIDLDRFKDVNDALGHGHGDQLLVEITRRIAPLVRGSDTLARPGGNEFAIILGDIGDPTHVEATARRLLEAIAPPCRLGDEVLHVTACIGVALSPADGVDATALMQHADLALRSAKDLGRNTIRFFSREFQEGLDRRMIVEKELWGADQEGRFSLLYQPQVDLGTGRITGVEALVRLRGRDGTALSPVEFIPIAEESELIFQLGDWVLRQACSDLAAFHGVAPELTMSVNYSARQFRGMDVGRLQAMLDACGVGARYLVIEITETALLDDPQETAGILKELRGVAGLRLSLDDFGTGYSSLTYVRMLHPDAIKIDRSFVALLPDDPEAQAIVLSTIALARGMHAKVVAEGPETEQQVRFLRANGCDLAQGYYFSRPIPADEMTLRLRSGAFGLPGVAIGAVRRAKGSLHRG